MALAIIRHLKVSNGSTRCDVIPYAVWIVTQGVRTPPPPQEWGDVIQRHSAALRGLGGGGGGAA